MKVDNFVSEESLIEVFNNPADFTARDFKAFNVDSIDKARAVVDSSAASYTASLNGKPIALAGVIDQGNDVYQTWFLATPDFYKNGRALTKWLNDLMDNFKQKNDVTKFISKSLCDSRLVETWFKRIGFYKSGEKIDNLYILERM